MIGNRSFNIKNLALCKNSCSHRFPVVILNFSDNTDLILGKIFLLFVLCLPGKLLFVVTLQYYVKKCLIIILKLVYFSVS